VICLRIQRERISADFRQPDAYHQNWGVTGERLARLAPRAHVMHPGPVNRNIEIADAVVDGRQSLVLNQVRNGVHARTALFERLLGGQRRDWQTRPRARSQRSTE
ncbi:MAG: aspartate carbamoyltransferase catalytic subunit, partial [Wenzhouxiangellaceae bacterium]